MRSRILSGPVCGLGTLSCLGSATSLRNFDCDDDDCDAEVGAFVRGELVVSFAGRGTWAACGVFAGEGARNCEIPAAMAVLVWTQRRNGLEWMMILGFFFGRCAPAFGPSMPFLSASRWCSRAAMRSPRALPCDQPP